MMSNAPDLGGKENLLADNLSMFIIFLSFYEATDHRIDGNAMDDLLEEIYKSVKFLKFSEKSKYSFDVVLKSLSKNPPL